MLHDSVHEHLIRGVLHERPSDSDAVVWMVILHNYAIRLRDPIPDVYPAPGYHPLTQREAADVVAQIAPQGRPIDWYWALQTLPGPDTHCIPWSDARRARVDELLTLLRSHPDIAGVAHEDCDRPECR